MRERVPYCWSPKEWTAETWRCPDAHPPVPDNGVLNRSLTYTPSPEPVSHHAGRQVWRSYRVLASVDVMSTVPIKVTAPPTIMVGVILSLKVAAEIRTPNKGSK